MHNQDKRTVFVFCPSSFILVDATCDVRSGPERRDRNRINLKKLSLILVNQRFNGSKMENIPVFFSKFAAG